MKVLNIYKIGLQVFLKLSGVDFLGGAGRTMLHLKLRLDWYDSIPAGSGQLHQKP